MTLTGGEPLVRKDLFEIIAVLKLCEIRVGMVSNGHNFAHFEAPFREQAPDALAISIDGLAETHDQLRLSPGSHAQTLERCDWQRPGALRP